MSVLLLFVRVWWLLAVVTVNHVATAGELRVEDLKDPAKVTLALQNKLDQKAAHQMERFVSSAVKAISSKRYGAAVKAWAEASLIQPNSANLVMLVESTLREIGSGSDIAVTAKRRETSLPIMLQFYESAIVAEKALPVLGGSLNEVLNDYDCLKTFVERKQNSKNCRPLIWSGVVGPIR
jgi:hypothetical protein